MNANELADILEVFPNMNVVKAATMLRQQQAEIEALRRHRAWIEETAVKELTDEEILNTWKECGESDIAKDMQVNSFLKYFARAILRKAQEK
jgi:hypothetical protein